MAEEKNLTEDFSAEPPATEPKASKPASATPKKKSAPRKTAQKDSPSSSAKKEETSSATGEGTAKPAAKKTTATKKTTAAKKTTTATKTTTAKKATGTTSKSASAGGTAKKATTAKKTATTKKTTTATAAKKTTAAKSTAAGKKTAAAKSTAAGKKTAAAKSTAAKKATPKPQEVLEETEVLTPPVEERPAEEPVSEGPDYASAASTREAVRYYAVPCRDVNDPSIQTETMPADAEPKTLIDTKPKVYFPVEEKHNPLGRLLIFLIIGAVLAISVLIFMHRPTSYTERVSSVSFLYREADNITVIAVNGTPRYEVAGTLEEKSYDESGRVCAAKIGNILYLIKGKKVSQLDADVVDFALSQSGDTIAWRVSREDHAKFIFCKTLKDDTEPSKYAVGGENTAPYCLSPDGKELVYVFMDEEGGKHLKIESKSGSAPYFFNDKDLIPLAVGDKCRYIYYLNPEGKILVYDRENDRHVLCSEKPLLDTLLFNRDFTELLLKEEGGTVLVKDGEKKIPEGVKTEDTLILLANRRVANRTLFSGHQYLVHSFYKNYYYWMTGTAKKLVYLDKKGKILDISFVDDIKTVTVTDKGVYFLKTDDGQNRVSLHHAKHGKTETERIAWDVAAYSTNVDGSRVLYADVQKALYSYRLGAGNVPQRISDSMQVATLKVTADDIFYFMDENGVLMLSENGNIPRLAHDKAVGVLADCHTVYYYVVSGGEGENTTYTIFSNYRNHRKDKEIATGISRIE